MSPSASSIQPSDRGKAPGIRISNGQWTGYSWRSGKPSRSEIIKWRGWNANFGLRSTFFPGIDIDVLDEDLAEDIEKLAIGILGDAPTRIGRYPKRLLI